MISVFRTKKLKPPSFIEKLRRTTSKENGFIKINNLFAQSSTLTEVPVEEVYQLLEEFNIQCREKQDRLQILKLYAQLLRGTIAQKQFQKAYFSNFYYFKRLFNLRDQDLLKVHKSVLEKHYKRPLANVLSMSLANEERNFVTYLEQQLVLAKPLRTIFLREHVAHLLQTLLQKSAHTEKSLQEQEILQLKALCYALHVPFSRSYGANDLQKFKLYWCIENAGFTPIEAPMIGLKNETCVLLIHAKYVRRRQRTRFVHYGSVPLHIKIIEGTYWKLALPAARELAKEIWEVCDMGDIYLTEKRIFFSGERSKKSLSLHKINNFSAYENGVEIEQLDGTSIFFALQRGVDIFTMFLGKAISEYPSLSS